MTVWEFRLPMTRPLSLNSRQHWAVKAREVAEVRKMGFGLAKHHKIPKGCGRIKVQLTYHPRSRRRADDMNLVATLKPFVDGLVDAQVIPDDTPQYLEPTMPLVGEPSGEKTGVLTVRIERLA